MMQTFAVRYILASAGFFASFCLYVNIAAARPARKGGTCEVSVHSSLYARDVHTYVAVLRRGWRLVDWEIIEFKSFLPFSPFKVRAAREQDNIIFL